MIHFKDTKTKSALSTRWAQMSKQEQIIERKKMEIQAKLESQKQAAALAAQAKLSNPTSKDDKGSVNIFSNDGSFMNQFKALLEKQKETDKHDKEEQEKQIQIEEELLKPVKNEIKEQVPSMDDELENQHYGLGSDERRKSVDRGQQRDKNRRWNDRGRPRPQSPTPPMLEERKKFNVENKTPHNIPALMQIPVMPPNTQSIDSDHNQWLMGSKSDEDQDSNTEQGPKMGSGPMGSGPLPPGPLPSSIMGPSLMGPGPGMGPGPNLGPGPNMAPGSKMGPGPLVPVSSMGPGPGSNMGPGQNMGPGSNMGPGPNMGPGSNMGPGPNMGHGNNMGPGPNMGHGPNMGPGHNMGPGPNMGPRQGMGPGPMMGPRGPMPHMPPGGPMPPFMGGPPNFPMPPNFMGPNGPGPCGPMPPNMCGPNMGPGGPGPNGPMPPFFGPPFPNPMMGPNGPPNSMMPPNSMNNSNMPFMGGRPPFGPNGPPNFGNGGGPPMPPFMPPNSMPPNSMPPMHHPDSNALEKAPMKPEGMTMPPPLPLGLLGNPNDMDSPGGPFKPSQVLSADAFPPSVLRAASEVACNGDHWENVLKAIHSQDQNLWFLHNTNSNEYKTFRDLVRKIRGEQGDKKPEVKPEDKYEPEFSLEDDDSNDDYRFHNKDDGRDGEEYNYGRPYKREQSSQSEDESDSKRERRKKKKSRWSDDPPPADIKPPGVVAPMPSLLAGAKLAKIEEDGMKLPTVNRSNQALMQYAMTNYGTTNLSVEDWKKCEDNFKLNLLYQDMLKKRQEVERLAAAGKYKYEYDSDEDTAEGTWEHKLRAKEMNATEKWADELTKQAAGKHHIGDFLPPEELRKFMEKYSAFKSGKEPDLSDYKEFKLKEDNVGFKMLQKLGWTEGQGLGAEGSGIVEPINKANQPVANLGLGASSSDGVSAEDDEFDAYRKRMMLAYRFRPNPLNNPRRPYY